MSGLSDTSGLSNGVGLAVVPGLSSGSSGLSPGPQPTGGDPEALLWGSADDDALTWGAGTENDLTWGS